MFEEFQVRQTESEFKELHNWQCFDDFETFWLIRNKPLKWIQDEWDQAINDPNRGAKKIAGQWCLPKFGGGVSSVATKRITGSGTTRQVAVKGASMQQDLDEEGRTLAGCNILT